MADMPAHSAERQIPATIKSDADPNDLVKILQSYREEAVQGRSSGPSPRDDVWAGNWDRYWGNYDMSNKAKWQAKYVMPETPQFVDRWSAAMREALESTGEWFDVVDDGGERADLVPHVKKVMKVLLSRCAHTPEGRRVGFGSVFEDQMKLGALMQLCSAVTWDQSAGWVNVESVDPREVWKDPKLRGLYRLREYFIDKHELLALAKAADGNGEPLYDVETIEQLSAAADADEQRLEKERSSGHSAGDGTARKPIKIAEWLCTIVNSDEEVLADGPGLVVVANDRYVIRGPEENPFWHGSDWIVSTPMVPVPLSAYGRTYMEDWTDVADAFIEMTNLILDGTTTSALRAFAALPGLLDDPTQLDEGISPNKIFKLDEDITQRLQDFIKEIDLGELPASAFQVWQALKQENREGAKLSEIALGQLAPNQGTTATEIVNVQQSGSAMIRSMARTIEVRYLEPTLTLVWQTALQHMDFRTIATEIGTETADMLTQRAQEFSDLKIGFRVTGISGLVDRQIELQKLLQILMIVGQNELLTQALLQRADPGKILEQLFHLAGVDMNRLKPTPMQQAAAAIAGATGAPAGGAAAPAAAPSSAIQALQG